MVDIKLVIHCADIHIRNVQRHEEYAQQLERFVEKCKEIAAPYDKDEVRIVIAGDLVHSKNQISNELIVFASVFLRKLEQIAKVIVISGNHDLVVDNQSRTDTLTALFETASALGTVGLSLNLTPQVGMFSKIILALLMFIGRVGSVTIMMGFSSPRKMSASKLPLEKVQIG